MFKEAESMKKDGNELERALKIWNDNIPKYKVYDGGNIVAVVEWNDNLSKFHIIPPGYRRSTGITMLTNGIFVLIEYGEITLHPRIISKHEATRLILKHRRYHLLENIWPGGTWPLNNIKKDIPHIQNKSSS